MENLSIGLKEARKAHSLDESQWNLNNIRHHCDRACELLDSAEEKTPGAARAIRRGLSIIDERIKELQEKATELCKKTKGTPYEELGREINRQGQALPTRDSAGVEKGINNMFFQLSAICAKMPEEERGEACEYLKKAKEEQDIEDKIFLVNIVLSKITSQMIKGEEMNKDSKTFNLNARQINFINNEKSKIGTQKNELKIEKEENKPNRFDIFNNSSIAASITGLIVLIFMEYSDVSPVVYNKHFVSVFLAIISFAIIYILIPKKR